MRETPRPQNIGWPPPSPRDSTTNVGSLGIIMGRPYPHTTPTRALPLPFLPSSRAPSLALALHHTRPLLPALLLRQAQGQQCTAVSQHSKHQQLEATRWILSIQQSGSKQHQQHISISTSTNHSIGESANIAQGQSGIGCLSRAFLMSANDGVGNPGRSFSGTCTATAVVSTLLPSPYTSAQQALV